MQRRLCLLKSMIVARLVTCCYVTKSQGAEKNMDERCPDLIILDVMFPESSTAGFELARTMKHFNDKLKAIPIMMLAAVNSEFHLGFSSSDIDEYWLPIEEFLEKPVDLDSLSKKVSEMLSNRN